MLGSTAGVRPLQVTASLDVLHSEVKSGKFAVDLPCKLISRHIFDYYL